MPLDKITLRPGINTQATQTLNAGGWSSCNLIRWKDGFLQRVGGWQRLFGTQAAAIVRELHAFEDLSLTRNLLIGTTTAVQVYDGSTLSTLSLTTPAAPKFTTSTNISPLGFGSTTYQVLQTAHGFTNGQTVFIGLTVSVGGARLDPRAVTVTRINADIWQFTWVSALSTIAATVPLFTMSSGSFNVSVALSSHGFSAGQIFTAQFDVTDGGSTVAVPAGLYTVQTVTDANHFTFTSSVAATSNIFGQFERSNSTGQVPFYAGGTVPTNPQNIFIDNLGQDVVFNWQNSSLYVRLPGQSAAQIISTAPSIIMASFVAMPQAQVIALGASVGGTQDPLLIAWSDAGTYDIWTASATNQAGTYRLSRGSRIIGGIQSPQTTLVWTDLDLWSMQYGGPPLVYQFTIMGSGCGLIAAKARAVLARYTYWMTLSGFYIYGDSGVQALPCPVWDVVFDDLDTDNLYKCFAGANSPFHEVWFFYPSLSGGTGEIDSYVKYNAREQLWDYGSLARTAWIDESVFGQPLAADLSKRIQQHETGYDDDGSAMSGAFAETGYFDAGGGSSIVFLDQVVPDFKWFGSDGALSIELKSVSYPSDAARASGPFSVTPDTRFISPRLRARQIALRIEWESRLGYNARVGAIRSRTAPAGRRS